MDNSTSSNKNRWTKEEIAEMGDSIKIVTPLSKAMGRGYFSKSVLIRHRLPINEEDFVYSYSANTNAYIKAYKSPEALELYLDKKL